MCAPSHGSFMVLSPFACPSTFWDILSQDRTKCFFQILDVLVSKEKATTQPSDGLWDSSQQCLNTTAFESIGQKHPDTTLQKEDKGNNDHEKLLRLLFFTTANSNHLNLWLGAMKYFCWFGILSHCLPPLAIGKAEITPLQIPHPNICTVDRNSGTEQCTELRKYQVENEREKCH